MQCYNFLMENMEKKKKRLGALDIVLYSVSALLLIGGVLLLLRQYVLFNGDYTPPPAQTFQPTAGPTASAEPDNTPSASPTATLEPTPTPYPYTRITPVTLYFLDAEVMTDIYPVGVIEEGDRKGQMDTIDDPDVAAWYEPGYAPGELGNALINGHKSWKGKIGRFSVLWDMKEGQRVAVEREDGSVLYFKVVSVDFYPYDDYPEEVMQIESDVAKLTLITCYGDFDHSAGTSKQRCVVVCELITDEDELSAAQ